MSGRIRNEGFVIPRFKNFNSDNAAGRYVLLKVNANVVKDEESGCWLWLGAASTNGYGQIWWEGMSRCASRWLWEQINHRRLRRRHVVGHLFGDGCMYVNCVRPSHLDLMTYAELRRRMKLPSGDEQTGTHCDEGHLFTFSNTRYVFDPDEGKSRRYCGTCMKERLARKKARASKGVLKSKRRKVVA